MEVDLIKAKIGLVFGLIAFIFVVVSLIGTWYTFSVEGSAMGVTVESTADFRLGDATVSAMGVEVTESYADMPDSDFKSVFSLTQMLTLLTLILTLLMFIFGILAAIGKMSGKIAGVMGILAMIFALITFVYFMAALPPAMEEETLQGFPGVTGFMGSDSVSVSGVSMDMTWGPGYAWYMMILAFVFALIGTVMLFGAKKEPAPVAPPMSEPMPPPPEDMMEPIEPPVE